MNPNSILKLCSNDNVFHEPIILYFFNNDSIEIVATTIKTALLLLYLKHSITKLFYEIIRKKAIK